MHKLGEKCDLIQEGGRITDPAIDKRMDFHFNAILDVVADWRKDKNQHQDIPLGGKKKQLENSQKVVSWNEGCTVTVKVVPEICTNLLCNSLIF